MDLSTLHDRLSTGPSLIEKAAQDVSEKRKALDTAKKDLERSKALVIVREGGKAKNQSILNANVVMDPEVDKAEAKVIEAHANYLIAMSKHDRQKDDFDAAKKHSNLMEAEMRSFGSQRPS